MKILIAGCGKVGSTLTKQLTSEGHEITLIDHDPEVLEAIMERYDVMGVQGNAAAMESLEQAGVEDADLLIAATDMDEVNLLSCLTAHGLNEKLHTIGRIRNPEYRRQAYEMRSVFGLNMVINPEREAATSISRLLKYPGFRTIETFAKGNVEIVEVHVTADSKLKNVALSQLQNIIHCTVLVCAIVRDDKCLMPDGSFVLKENDHLYITATTSNLSALLRSLGIISKPIKNVLIAGGGRISYYLASQLQESGMTCEIIEQNAKRCEELALLLPDARVVQGDASNQNFMETERIDSYDALVMLTGLDELNIVMALYGSARGVKHVVTKVSHGENNLLLNELEIGSVVSPKELSCNTIVQYVRAMQNRQGAAITIHRIAGGQAEAIEFIIDENSKYIGEKIKNLKLKKNVLISSISRGENTEIASGNSSYELDDTVVVITNSSNPILQFNDIFEAEF